MSPHQSRTHSLTSSLLTFMFASFIVVGCGSSPASGPGSGSAASSNPVNSTSSSAGSGSPGTSSPGSGFALAGPLSTINVKGWIRSFAYNSATNTIYAAIPAWGTEANPSVGQLTNSPNGTLVVIDGATGNIVTTVSVAPSSASYAFTGSVAVDSASNVVYISDETDNQVIAVNGRTNTIVARIPVGTQPSGLAADPATGTIYVANSIDGTVSVISEATNTVTATVSDHLGGKVDEGTGLAESVAINSASGLVYIADSHDKTLTVISENNNQIQAVWSVGNSPEALLLDPSHNTLYVADYFDSTVSALNATTGVSNATISTGYGPTGLALDPTTNTLYVSVNGGANIIAIDVQKNSVLGESGLISGSYEIGVNSTNHTVYVAASVDGLATYQGVSE